MSQPEVVPSAVHALFVSLSRICLILTVRENVFLVSNRARKPIVASHTLGSLLLPGRDPKAGQKGVEGRGSHNEHYEDTEDARQAQDRSPEDSHHHDDGSMQLFHDHEEMREEFLDHSALRVGKLKMMASVGLYTPKKAKG
ncbi:uncharacterized protein BCR38DRAFT_474411 [Pseudomassariella vexata]|uniref:Uncharacterized protein n=1 Tax=Pseudomassariella vexata TaxID=1141098 RepID=A0A1Y2E204_9PEZI|nr:uncharacterized protein BCR38DRAFT_474411 [Pseudomassariella vexata]ORY65539.1 hypothetical protein BCR38DRAFT_474411 [Pseudomassariella vexata]